MWGWGRAAGELGQEGLGAGAGCERRGTVRSAERRDGAPGPVRRAARSGGRGPRDLRAGRAAEEERQRRKPEFSERAREVGRDPTRTEVRGGRGKGGVGRRGDSGEGPTGDGLCQT